MLCQVLAAAMKVASQMQKNVKSLKEIQQKLIELNHPKEVFLLDDTVDMFTLPPPGKRWGVKMCGYAIDETFWSSFQWNLLIAISALVFVVPLVVMAGANRVQEREKKQVEEREAKAKEREEQQAAKRAEAEAKGLQAEQAKLEVS